MSTLELYWPLASNRSNERLKASNDLISLLENFQQNFKSSNEESDEEDEDMNEVLEDNPSKIKHIEAFIEKHHASDVSYAIKRLIRGLASPRESSRLGFAVTLTQVRFKILFSYIILKDLKLITSANISITFINH